MKNKMSKLARKYFLHADDTDFHGRRVCYFSQTGDEDGWGVWIDANGGIDVDVTSADGSEPSARLQRILAIAARKYLM